MQKNILIFTILLSLLLLKTLCFSQNTVYIVKGGVDTGTFTGGVFMGLGAKIVYGITDQRVLLDAKPGIIEQAWSDVIGINQSPTNLTKIATNGWGNAGAVSNSKLDTLENGWIQYKVDNLTNTLAFGLSISNVDAHYNTINYTVMINAGQLSIYNNGQLIGNYGTVALNDSIRISRIGNILFFTKNNQDLYNQAIDAKQALMADVAIYTQGAVVQLKSSFAKPCDVNFNVIVSPVSYTITSGNSTALTASGATAFIWSNGATTSSINVAPTATTSYTVTGIANGCVDTASATVTVINTQTDCTGAELIQNGFIFPLHSAIANDISWYKFTPDSANTIIAITAIYDSISLQNQIIQADLYSGNCNNLVLLQTKTVGNTEKTIFIEAQGLSAQQTYFLKVYNGGVSTQYSITLENRPLTVSSCQDRISNGGFETYSSLPNCSSPTTSFSITLAPPWYNGNSPFGNNTALSPDYHHTASPLNGNCLNFSETPRTGSAVAGVGSSAHSQGKYREYIQAPTLPLVNGSMYRLEFYYRKVAQDASQYIPNIAACLKTSSITYPFNESPLPKIETAAGNGWIKVTSYWTYPGVTGASAFMAIGDFQQAAVPFGLCYFLVDDVSMFEAPIITINGPTSFCTGDNVTTTLTASPGSGFNWTSSPSLPGFPITGATATITAPLPPQTSTVTYNITLTNTTSSGCTTTSTLPIIVQAGPPQPVISGNLNFCIGSSTILHVSTIFPSTIQWFFNGSPIVGASGSTFVNYTVSTPGVYTVRVSFNNGSCPVFSNPVTVVQKQLPTIFANSASSPICNGSSTYLVVIGGGANPSYNWQPASSLNNSTIFSPLASPTVTTTYTVSVTDNNGCTNSTPVTVEVDQGPIALATPTAQTICTGTTANISLSSLSPNTTFTWTASQTDVSGASAGSGTSIVQTLTATGGSAGSVTYTITPTANGCAGTPITATVTVNPASCCLANLTPLTGNISNYTGPNTGQNFTVTGTLIINQNYTFSGCNIIMDPNAVIQVNSGRTLNIINQTHIYACTSMWDRISVQNNAILNVNTNSLIEDGIRAIYVATNGKATIQNAILNKNLRAIELASNNTLVSPLTLTGSVITSRNITTFATVTSNPTATAVWNDIISLSPVYTPTILKQPFACIKGNYGVFATNVRTLNVGLATATFNGFDEVLCGVFISTTSGNPIVQIYNNKFRNIKGYFIPPFCPPPPFVAEDGYGIRAISTSMSATTIIVGGTIANQTNDFYNIYSGIKIEGYKDTRVIKNTFDNLITGPFLGQINYGNGGVSVTRPASQNTINVSQNTIKNCSYGIWVNRPTFASCNSQAITLNTNAITSNGTATGYCVNGISIQNGVNSTATNYDAIKIQFNTITQTQHCITASNVKRGLLISLNTELGIAYDATLQRNGIRLLSCENAKVYDNCWIHSMQANTYLQSTADIRGIYVDNTKGVQVKCNKVYDVSKSLLFERSCVSSNNLATIVRENQLLSAYYGLYMLNSAQLGTQGSPTLATENYWYGTYNKQTYVNNVTNVNTASIFYVRNGIANAIPNNHGTFLPLQNYFNGTGIIAINGGAATPSCSCIAAIAPPDGDPTITQQSATLLAMVQDTNSTDVFAENVKWQNKKYAYQKLDENPQLLSGNGVLANFHNNAANTNVARFAKVEKQLTNSNYNAANAINSTINANGQMPENQKRINELLLLSEINTNYSYSTVEVNDAYTIAQQCPITGGDAVIQARTWYSYMIGNLTEFEDVCVNQSQRNITDETSEEKTLQNIRLYPNPNDGNMILEYQLAENENGVLIIYDITGKAIRSYNFNNSTSKINIDASMLNSGVYLYDVFINNNKIKTDKVIIAK